MAYLPCLLALPQVADDSNGAELSIFDPRAQPWVQVCCKPKAMIEYLG